MELLHYLIEIPLIWLIRLLVVRSPYYYYLIWSYFLIW